MNIAMTLRQLRYLVAVADHLHFGRAAEACHVSQPSLSAQIRELEEILGVALFDRTSRRVRPTPAGEAVAARARRVLAEAEALVDAARHAAEPLVGTFRLGVIPTLGPWYLPKVLPSLRAAFPDLRLYIREDLTDRLTALLDQGDVDAALLALPIDQEGLEAEPLFEEPFLLAAPKESRLAHAGKVDLGELKGERLLLLEDGHCLRDQALEVCRMKGAGDAEPFEATSLTTLKEMVASGLGVTLLPSLACAAGGLADGSIEVRRFADPEPGRTIGLVHRRAGARAREARLLAEVLRRHTPDQVREPGRQASSSPTAS